MYRLIEPYFAFSDARGEIKGVLNFGVWREINCVSSAADMKRGDHYHRDTEELFFFLSGRIRVTVQRVADERLVGPMEEFEVAAGAIFVVETMVNHVFHILDDAKWINVLSKPIDPLHPDIHRVPLPSGGLDSGAMT